MARQKRPSVTTAVADRYARGNSRIVEFNANDGSGRGGLISFRVLDDGTFQVEIYRTDRQVRVIAPRES
jgi:hypothetical protein